MSSFFLHQWLKFLDIFHVFTQELRRIFTDFGVIVIFFIATLVYPLIYKALYWHELIENIPVAVVDLSSSSDSRRFIHQWDATPDVAVSYYCTSMAEAEELLRAQKVHGILYFPRDFAQQLADPLGQAHVSLYCDMSSFLYMKGVYLSCNMVMLESMQNIQIDRYEQMGYDKQFAWSLVQDAPYTETALFNPVGGYGSFLIPAVLMMILHQTLLLGICMLAGTAREENDELFCIPGRPRSKSVLRIILGRAGAYFLVYYGLAVILLILLPRLFQIPHLGQVYDLMRFIVPYLLACIFFSMSISVFTRNRESGILLFISTSLVFLFIAGISWPQEMIPKPWVYLSYFIPYTWGAHGFIHISSMGATLFTTRMEYDALWILAGGWFLVACALYYITGATKHFTEVKLKSPHIPHIHSAVQLSLPRDKE